MILPRVREVLDVIDNLLVSGTDEESRQLADLLAMHRGPDADSPVGSSAQLKRMITAPIRGFMYPRTLADATPFDYPTTKGSLHYARGGWLLSDPCSLNTQLVTTLSHFGGHALAAARHIKG